LVLIALAWPIYRALVETKQADPTLYRLVTWIASWRKRKAPPEPSQPAAENGEPASVSDFAADIEAARRRSLRLAFYAATIGMGLWVIAGALSPPPSLLGGAMIMHYGRRLRACAPRRACSVEAMIEASGPSP
jgi:hypothetical protein